MAETSNDYLKPNPFKTYRDPQTGLWVVIKPSSVAMQKISNTEILSATFRQKCST
ncbi:hypothetical protein [Rippkaea orientalis]|uniref:hypothetical protein n=1 Tax=Rippkaea orientalis TaxID=2546366 RepID=UPI000172549B|nr:hypothetical protein [Rippkaea orientalis]